MKSIKHYSSVLLVLSAINIHQYQALNTTNATNSTEQPQVQSMNLSNLTTASEIKKQLEAMTGQTINATANASLPAETSNLQLQATAGSGSAQSTQVESKEASSQKIDQESQQQTVSENSEQNKGKSAQKSKQKSKLRSKNQSKSRAHMKHKHQQDMDEEAFLDEDEEEEPSSIVQKSQGSGKGIDMDVGSSDIANAADEISKSQNQDLDELNLSKKTLMADKSAVMAQKASVEESLEVKNTDDEAPPEQRPKVSLADRKVEVDDDWNDDWADDKPIQSDKSEELQKKVEAKQASKKTKKGDKQKKLKKNLKKAKNSFRAQTAAEAQEDAKILDDELGLDDEPQHLQHYEHHTSKSLVKQLKDDKEKADKEAIKKHKTYKNMMKRFLPATMEKKANKRWSYGWHLNEEQQQENDWDGEGDDKEKEGYFPQEGETDGVVGDQYHYDYQYGYPYYYNRRYGYGINGLNRDRNNTKQPNNTKEGEPEGKDSGAADDSLKKTEQKEAASPDAASPDAASPDAASPGMPPELNPNFVQKKSVKQNKKNGKQAKKSVKNNKKKIIRTPDEQKEDLDNDGDQPESLTQKSNDPLDQPDMDDASNTLKAPKSNSIAQKKSEELDGPDLDDNIAIQRKAHHGQLSKKIQKQLSKAQEEALEEAKQEVEDDDDEEYEGENEDIEQSQDDDEDAEQDETNVQQKAKQSQQVMIEVKSASEKKAKMKTHHMTDGEAAWGDAAVTLLKDPEEKQALVQSSTQKYMSHKKPKHHAKKAKAAHKKELKGDESMQDLAQKREELVKDIPKVEEPVAPKAEKAVIVPKVEKPDALQVEKQVLAKHKKQSIVQTTSAVESKNETSESPSESSGNTEESSESSSTSTSGASNNGTNSISKQQETAYANAKETALTLESEYQELKSKAKATEVAAAKARKAAKDLKISMGAASNSELADIDSELGVKASDANVIKNSNITGGNLTSSSSGISLVHFTVETKDQAENLVSKLFKELLVADAQVYDNNSKRLFMKFKKQSESDASVKIRMVTADDRIPALIRFILKNNPNEHNTDIAPDVVATHFNSGSKEYIKWVKEQTQERDILTKSGEPLTDVVDKVESETANAASLEEANIQMKAEDQSISGLTSVKKALTNNIQASDKKMEKKQDIDSKLYDDHDDVMLDAIDAVDFY